MAGYGDIPRRIHIIGGAASGKTTLARQLGVRLGVAVYHLDAIAYEDGAGDQRQLDARLSYVSSIASKPTWITEGVYLWWTDDLLRASDVIVWLNVPWRVAAWRISSRHIRRSLAGKNPHSGLRNLIHFLRWTRRYYLHNALVRPAAPDNDKAITRAGTDYELEQYKGKALRCENPSDVDSLLASLASKK